MIVNETECFLLRIAIFMEILDQRKTGTVMYRIALWDCLDDEY